MRKYYKASYTVEAAVILPLILFTVCQGIKIGIDLCMEVKAESVYSADLEKLQGTEIFYRTNGLEELWRDLHGDGV